MTNDDKKKLYAALSAGFPEEAIERSLGRVTGRGYDTTGIGYQFIVNRLNEVLGIGGFRTEQKIDIRTGTNSKGRTVYDATCEIRLELGEWKEGMFEPFAEAFSVGGHASVNEADARKGAFTNGFEKCAAMFGCGKQAYEGTIDDDNVPSEDSAGYANNGTGYSAPQHARSNADPRPEPPPPTGPQPRPQSAPQPQSRPPQTNSATNAPTNGTGTPAHNPSGSQANNNSRNRLTSKQLAAIWALARKLGMDQRQFREQVKARFKVQPEFLDKNAASTIIGELAGRASNGAVHPASEHADQPGAGA